MASLTVEWMWWLLALLFLGISGIMQYVYVVEWAPFLVNIDEDVLKSYLDWRNATFFIGLVFLSTAVTFSVTSRRNKPVN